jgi:hypothetical protein
MNPALPFQDAKCFLTKLTPTREEHEDWLLSLWILSCAAVLEMAERVVRDAEYQARLAEEADNLLEVQLAEAPPGGRPGGMEGVSVESGAGSWHRSGTSSSS